jgi:hypothetical protein
MSEKDGKIMNEFIEEFSRIRDIQKEQIEKLFEKQSCELKQDFKEVKDELKKLNIDRENTNKTFVEYNMRLKSVENDLNNLGEQIRANNKNHIDFMNSINRIKWEISLAKWLGGLGIGVACSTLVVVFGIIITKKMGG